MIDQVHGFVKIITIDISSKKKIFNIEFIIGSLSSLAMLFRYQ